MNFVYIIFSKNRFTKNSPKTMLNLTFITFQLVEFDEEFYSYNYL